MNIKEGISDILKQNNIIMVNTRKTLLFSNEEANNGNGKEISQSSRTTVSSLRTPTNNPGVNFEKNRRKSCTFLNIHLKVVHNRDTSTVEST